MELQQNQKALHVARLMHTAAAQNNSAQLAAYKEAGVDLNAQGSEGKTACHLAAEHSALKAIATLHTIGADMNMIDKHGGAPIHWAIVNRQPKVVYQLLEHGAQLTVTTQQPKIEPCKIRRNLPGPAASTVFHVAAYRNNPEAQDIKRILLMHALFAGLKTSRLIDDPLLRVAVPYHARQLSAEAFIDMLGSYNQVDRQAACVILAKRVEHLKALLAMKDSHDNLASELEKKVEDAHNTAPLFCIDNMQHDYTNFIMAVEANAIEKLPATNLFKAAHDAMEKYSPGSQCIIC